MAVEGIELATAESEQLSYNCPADSFRMHYLAYLKLC